MRTYDYRNSIGFIITKTAKVFVKALDSELRGKVGVSFSQWKLLVILSVQDGITQKEIANKLELEAATIIPIIDKMEKEGLIVRQADKSDRRNNRIYRTDKSNAIWEQMIECATKIRENSVKDVSENHLTIMRNCLEKICNNLNTHFGLDCDYSDVSTSVGTSIPSSNRNVKRK